MTLEWIIIVLICGSSCKALESVPVYETEKKCQEAILKINGAEFTEYAREVGWTPDKGSIKTFCKPQPKVEDQT